MKHIGKVVLVFGAVGLAALAHKNLTTEREIRPDAMIDYTGDGIADAIFVRPSIDAENVLQLYSINGKTIRKTNDGKYFSTGTPWPILGSSLSNNAQKLAMQGNAQYFLAPTADKKYFDLEITVPGDFPVTYTAVDKNILPRYKNH